MSVADIKIERIYNEQGIPNFNAINDPRLGTMDKELKCMMCKGSKRVYLLILYIAQADCPGHFGHIELAKPVFHAGLIEYIRKVLRIVCFNCSKLLAPRKKETRDEIMKIKNNKARFNKVFKMGDSVK